MNFAYVVLVIAAFVLMVLSIIFARPITKWLRRNSTRNRVP